MQLCFSIYRSSDRGKFCSNFILLWTASNACASVRQTSLAWVCGKERNQYQECILINIIIVPNLIRLHKTLSRAQGKQRAHKPPQGYTLKQPSHPILILLTTPKFNNDIVYNIILPVLHNYSTYIISIKI